RDRPGARIHAGHQGVGAAPHAEGQGIPRRKPELRVLPRASGHAARPDRRARRSAHAGALDRGRPARDPARRARLPRHDTARQRRAARAPDGRAGYGRRDQRGGASGLLLGIRRCGRRARGEDAPIGAHVGALPEGSFAARALRRERLLTRGYFAASFAFASANRFSSSGIVTAPGRRSPSSKMSVGVPRMCFAWPYARFFSSGAWHVPAVAGRRSRTIVSIHALPGSVEHQMALDLSTESGARIGYRKTYAVTSVTPWKSRSKRLQ